MNKKCTLNTLQSCVPELSRPSLVFLYGDLWAWKTTFSGKIIQKYTSISDNITSPTYVYYNIYEDIFHFDLYRIKDYSEFVSIWWEEILDNNEWIILIEWPEILEPFYEPDFKIYIEKSGVFDWERQISIEKKKT